MQEGTSDSGQLPIRCPSCGQRFKVGPELRGRMVECGTCDHRFRIGDEVIVRQKKMYPGERRPKSLDRFARVPISSGLPANFQTASYSTEPPPQALEPTSPLRLILGLAAVIVIVVSALILMLGGGPGGMIDGAPLGKRLALAAFAGAVAAALLVGANPRARVRAVLGGVLAAGFLVSLPFFFRQGERLPEGIGLVPAVSRDPGAPAGDPEAAEAEDPYAGLKKRIGYEPLAAEIGKQGDGSKVAGLWLRGLREFHKLQVRDYILRATGADPSSHMYPRPPDYLMVVSGGSADLLELEEICKRFGEVRDRIDALRVIEVVVNNESFVEGDPEKLAATGSDAFYELNRRELESIDLQRAKKAVVRLAEAEPKIYRKDIVKRLQQLMIEGDSDLQSDVARALDVWAEEGDGSQEIVREAALKLSSGKGGIPESVVHFLVLRKDPAILPVVDALWAENPTQWEEHYGLMGPMIEDAVLARFGEASSFLKLSAVRMLTEFGTEKSLPALEEARQQSTGELRAVIDKAIAAIRSRS